MTPERLGALVCLLIVLCVAIVRLPIAIRDPRARASWVALVVGAAAFVAAGAVTPLRSLDAIIGGANYINLVQNSLATFAFWIFLQTVKGLNTGAFAWKTIWHVPLITGTFAAPFMAIDSRGGTSEDFINDYADQWSLWAYASIYMGWIIALATLAIVSTHGHTGPLYLVLRLGCFAAALGSGCEIVYLTLRALGRPNVGAVDQIRELFPPLFYGGVALIALSMAGFWAVRTIRRMMFTAIKKAMLQSTTFPSSPRIARYDDSKLDTYIAAIALVDAHRAPMNWIDRMTQVGASHFLDRQVNAPHILSMRVMPEREVI